MSQRQEVRKEVDHVASLILFMMMRANTSVNLLEMRLKSVAILLDAIIHLTFLKLYINGSHYIMQTLEGCSHNAK